MSVQVFVIISVLMLVSQPAQGASRKSGVIVLALSCSCWCSRNSLVFL